MRFILVFIAFNLIVIVHELGHFIAAKLSDIKVHEFSIFFGPRLFGIKIGETDYNFRLLPIGGYVRLEGEEEESQSERAYNKKSLPVRASVLFAGPLMNLVFALIILSVVFLITGYSTTEIGTVIEDSAADKAGIKEGDRIVSWEGRRVYQPMDVGLFLYYSSKDSPAEIEVVRDDEKFTTTVKPRVIPPQNRYLLGFVPKSVSGPESNVVESVDPNSPAGKAGLKPGDEIIKLDDAEITERQQINDYVSERKNNPIKVTIIRDGSRIELTITPYLVETQEQYDIGVAFSTTQPNIFRSVRQSTIYAVSTIRSVYLSITWMITGVVSVNQVMGPIGIISAMNDVVQESPTFSLVILNLLNISAFISIALGITNLLPIPPADGSKLILLGVEGIRRKPIPVEKEAFIMMTGFILLLVLMVFITYNDIVRIIFGS